MKEIDIKDLEKINPFTKIEHEWALLTSGDINAFNPMTVNWFTLGYLWKKNVAIVYVRPQRYTYKYSESSDYISLSFFEEKYRNVLNICGSKSGKDIDKVKECNIHPLDLNNGVGYEEANLIIIGRKIYADTIKNECFLDNNVLNKCYPSKDFHKFYILEIEHVYIK